MMEILFKHGFVVMVATGVLCGGLAFYLLNPKSSADPAGGYSGLHVMVDALTGCQYLATQKGGLTPRLDANGKQICGGVK